MAAIETLFFRNADNVADAATFTASVAPDATYLDSYIHDEISARPVIYGASGVNLLWEYAAAQRVDAVVIPVHNFNVAATVILRGHATNLGAGAWGAASLTKVITIPAYTEDDHSKGIHVDVTVVPGYLVAGYKFWRIEVSGNTAEGYVAIGEVLLYTTKRTFSGISGNWQWVEGQPTIKHQTTAGIRIRYPRGWRYRRLFLNARLTDATKAELLTINRGASGPNLPITIILNTDTTSPHSEPIVGFFQEDALAFSPVADGLAFVANLWDTQFLIDEDARGLPL